MHPFTDSRVAGNLADQAVIAIENTRLFEAEQASKRELAEPLELQTATSKVLEVISRSPTHAQPVFDAIAQSAARLCHAYYAGIFQLEDDRPRLVAHHAPKPWPSQEKKSSFFRRSPIKPSLPSRTRGSSRRSRQATAS